LFPKDAGGRWAPALVISAIFACSAAASEAETAAETPVQGVPTIPLAADISSLDRVELRREIGRTEGRLSDLRKEHAAAMHGLAAAAERIPDRTSDPNDDQAGNKADGQIGEQPEPERSPADRRADVADRRRRATAQFERHMAAARHRLEQLLDRQALIDPAALDQTRLRPAPARPPATAEADAR
jgi:hypothetical protein